jgi:hypothetical protein
MCGWFGVAGVQGQPLCVVSEAGTHSLQFSNLLVQQQPTPPAACLAGAPVAHAQTRVSRLRISLYHSLMQNDLGFNY